MSLDIRVWDIDGTNEQPITGPGEIGYIVGPAADDAMILWVGTFAEAGTAAKMPRRYVGAGFEEISGVPAHFEQAIPPYDFHTYAGAAYRGQVVILLAVHQESGDKSAFIYRSEDGGHSFTQVHTWATSNVFKGSPLMVAYNGATQDSWWVNGALSGMTFGLWHSTDNGLTWTFVDVGLTFDAPAIYSAARPPGTPV
jgi:hypothetical protein